MRKLTAMPPTVKYSSLHDGPVVDKCNESCLFSRSCFLCNKLYQLSLASTSIRLRTQPRHSFYKKPTAPAYMLSSITATYTLLPLMMLTLSLGML
jgi:hypothetical protein